MAVRTRRESAVAGVADHCGWAVLVTVAGGANLVDRRQVELVDEALPKLPHHHECRGLPVADAVALVERVRRSADMHSAACLEALAAGLSTGIAGIALRACPPLPATVEERISDYRSQNVADSVMYRNALARAAEARGWSVHWYDPRRVLAEAATALGRQSIDDLLDETGAALGPPWRKDHRVAMAAAIAAAARE